MENNTSHPVYVKISLNLLTISLIIAALYLGRSILIPFFFAMLLAMLLHPIVRFLKRLRFSHVMAVLTSVVLSFLLIASLIYFLSTQVGTFLQDTPVIKQKITELGLMGKRWISEHFEITIRDQNEYIDETTEKMSENNPTLVERTVLTLTELISYLIFFPVYTFLILYHKDLIVRFLSLLVKRSEEDKIMDVLYESQHIVQGYIAGLLIEVGIVFVLNTTGFLLIGIEYAVFLALIAALLNIIPYIGMLIANVLTLVVTLVSSENPIDAIWACGILAVVQVVDNNLLMPLIVGSKIKINALAIIIGVVFGGAVAGIPGMFLAIPGLALLKVVFESVDTLKPWAVILGDETNEKQDQHNFIKRALNRAMDRQKNRKE